MANRDPLHLHLEALPEPELPAHLLARLEQARGHVTRRRWGWGTATCLLVAMAVLPLRQPPPEAPSRDVPTAHRMVAGSSDFDARLRALDRDLQAAYDRNSSDVEIAQLWIARRALLASQPGQAARPTRI